MLAKLLLAEPNLMLLDEPSNHLDIEATEWLEDFSLESSAALLLVSHDRCFLDNVTNRTLELFRGTVDSYAGNFTAYWQQKAERLLVERRTYEKQQMEIDKAKEFIRRNHYGQKRAQAEDRRKNWSGSSRCRRRGKSRRPPWAFRRPPASRRLRAPRRRLGKSSSGRSSPDVDLKSSAASVGGYWAQRLRQDHPAALPAGAGPARRRAGPAGPGRGSGLLRPAVGRVGRRTAGRGRHPPAAQAVQPAAAPRPAGPLRHHRRHALQRVGSLSGGERCRAALARLAAADANFLVLDEPTNHLDLWARDALEQAVPAFDGTVLFVSHDRYFVNQVADHLLVFEGGRVQVIEGNYEAYQLQAGRKAAEAVAGEAAAPPPRQAEKKRAGRQRHSLIAKWPNWKTKSSPRDLHPATPGNWPAARPIATASGSARSMPRSSGTRRRWAALPALGGSRRNELVRGAFVLTLYGGLIPPI